MSRGKEISNCRHLLIDDEENDTDHFLIKSTGINEHWRSNKSPVH